MVMRLLVWQGFSVLPSSALLRGGHPGGFTSQRLPEKEEPKVDMAGVPVLLLLLLQLLLVVVVVVAAAAPAPAVVVVVVVVVVPAGAGLSRQAAWMRR
jgi:hypothetical protein